MNAPVHPCVQPSVRYWLWPGERSPWGELERVFGTSSSWSLLGSSRHVLTLLSGEQNDYW